MRIALTTLSARVALLIALLTLLIGSTNFCHAGVPSKFNAASASLVDDSAIPTDGVFWSIDGKFPPSPFDPFPQLPLYTDGSPGNFWFDDRDFDYQAYWEQMSSERTISQGGERAMDVPALPGDGGTNSPDSGTNSPDGGGSPDGTPMPTNELWLGLNGITNGVVSLTLNNATDMVYEVWSTDSLTNSLTNWDIEQEVWPVTNGTVTPFSVNEGDRTNGLFFYARDWTGITSDENTTPEWWFWKYFGTVDLLDSDLDSTGTSLLYDYQHNIDPGPNNIYFVLNVTNQYWSTRSPTVQITVSGGTPSVMAVLLDSLDYSNSNWTPYNSNVVVNLGSVEGWHTVSVGLRGLPSDAPQAWDQIQLKLLLTLPLLIVTNPLPGVVTQPFIQLQGYCPENLAGMSYDLSNAASFISNQQVVIANRQFDTNTFESTTNNFECFNIPLVNGNNTVTLHATDMAGNLATTNLVYVLDPTANNNPPVISLSWPQNNASISGTNFPVSGVVNDPFATVAAQVVNDSVTNSVNGLVEQNGSFWIENVPLDSGTTYLTITATNAAGYGSSTNIIIDQSAVTLTIGSVSFNDPTSPTATVNGVLSGSTDNVWINGVEATNNEDGTWTAYYVPVGDSGTAAITAAAMAGNGSADDIGFPPREIGSDETSQPDAQTSENVSKGPEIMVVDYHWIDNYTLQYYNLQCPACGFVETGSESVNWTYGSGGNMVSSLCYTASSNSYNYDKVIYDANGNGTLYVSAQAAECGVINIDSVTPDWSFYEFNDPYNSTDGVNINQQESGVWGTEEEVVQQQAQTLAEFKTGGQALQGQQNLWAINISTANFFYVPFGGAGSSPIPPGEVTCNGQTLDASGNIYLSMPNNANVNLAVTAPSSDCLIAMNYTGYQAQIQANGVTLDPVKTNATFCVGQQVSFSLSLASLNGTPFPTNGVPFVCHWTLPGTYVNSIIPNPPGSTIYTNNSGLLTTTNGPCVCWYVNGSGGTVSVQGTLTLTDGKTIPVSAVGQFAIVAPAITDFEPQVSPPPLQVSFDTNGGASVSAFVSFRTYVLPPYDFSGTGTYAQLVQSSDSYYTSVYGLAVHNGESTGGGYWLDNTYPYAADPPVTLSWDDDPVKYVAHNDNPGLEPGSFPFVNSITITNLFKTYLQFQPTGGIPVTIGRIDWGWSCIAIQSNGIWSWTLTTNQPATNWNDNSFPQWTNTFHNN
jgi:hypothetical protein